MRVMEKLRFEESAPCQGLGIPIRRDLRKQSAIDTKTACFQSHRARLFAIACRMLRSRAEAEDLLQEIYLRWHQSATTDVQSPVAFLVTMTTRLCLDRLRQLKQERERCVPEPFESVVGDESASGFPSPETQLELAEDVAAAFCAALERLGPGERAAFLLHDVFDYDYAEVAQVVGKTEPTCRQMIHRARERVREPHARFCVTPESRERVLGKFLAAVRTGDPGAISALLAEEVDYVADASVDTFALRKQRPFNDVKPLPLFDSVARHEQSGLFADRARPLNDPRAGVSYVCPGRAQELSDRGTGGVYEMDNETYQTAKVG